MKNLLRRHRVPLLAALTAGGMLLLLYVLLGVWPFGPNTVLTGDLNSQYVAYFSHFKRALTGQAGFGFSFEKGLGGALAGLFAYYAASPFNLVYLLTPLRWFGAAAGLVFFLKTLLSCVFFSLYISKKLPALCASGAVALSLGYGFCTYAVVYAQNIMWHDAVLLLPLICLGIDRLIAGGRPVLYGAALALAIFANFYIAFMVCVFSGFYFLYGMLCRPAPRRLAGRKGPLPRFAAASLWAGGVNAALLLPALADINASKGEILSYSFSPRPLFNFGQLREHLVWGNFFPEELNGQMPFIYCGILALLLLALYFLHEGIPLREKLPSAGLLLLLLASFWIEGLNNLWHGLKAPVYFPARYSFLFCFWVLSLAAAALARGPAGPCRLIAAAGILGAVYLAAALFPITTSRARIALSFCAALFFAGCLYLRGRAAGARAAALTSEPAPAPVPAQVPAPVPAPPRARRRLWAAAGGAGLVALSALELSLNAFFVTDKLEKYPLADYQRFTDTAGGAVSDILLADAGDYRIAEGWFRSLNDPLLLGYRGLSHFGSTMDSIPQNALYSLGYRAYGGAGPYLSGSTPFADAFLGLRYYAGEESPPPHWQAFGIKAALPVWQNPQAMPLAFTVADTSPQSGANISEAPREENSFAFQNAVYSQLWGGGLFYPAADIARRRGEGGPLAEDGPYYPGDVFEMTAPQTGPYYALLKGPHADAGLFVNGREAAQNYLTAENMGPVCLGHFKAGEAIRVTLACDAAVGLEYALFYGMDEAALAAAAKSAAQNAAHFNLQDGFFSATVSAGDASLLFTSIPYSGVWQALVNGRPVQPRQSASFFLSIPLAAGENTVELRYVPPGGGPAGGLISLLFVLAAAAWLFGRRLWRRRDRGPR